MAKSKIHWYWGCTFGRACRHEISANTFLADSLNKFCVTCTKAARLALAKDSAPKPSDVVWPKPRPISDAPKDGCILGWVPATDELRAGWELLHYSVSAAEWRDLEGVAHEPTHFLPLPPEVK